MKKFFTQQIHFAYALIVMLTLTLGVTMASAALPEPGVSSISPLMHQGGGEQAMLGLRLGACAGGLGGGCSAIGTFDARGNMSVASLFEGNEDTDPFMAVLGNTAFLGRLFIGDQAGPNLPMWTANYGGGLGGTFSAPLQRVNVYGNARAVNLTNSEPNAPVCVTKTGVITLCPDGGSCGLSHGGTFSAPPSAGLCSLGSASAVSTNSTTYNWNCTALGGSASCFAYRDLGVNGVCNTFENGPYATQPANSFNGCMEGTYVDTPSDTTSLWRWSCNGIAGGSSQVCSAEREVATYHWEEGPWGTCSDSGSCSGTYTPGACDPLKYIGGGVGPGGEQSPYEGEWCGTLPENLCPDLGPNAWMYHPCTAWDDDYGPSQSCSGLSQSVCGEYDGCTWTPGQGTQTRTVVCKDTNGNTVADNLCPPPKPATSQSCTP